MISFLKNPGDVGPRNPFKNQSRVVDSLSAERWGRFIAFGWHLTGGSAINRVVDCHSGEHSNPSVRASIQQKVEVVCKKE